MPINQRLVSYGLRQASESLHQDKLRRRQRREESGVMSGTSTATGTGERPEAPELPKFTAPEYDESKVAAKTQKIAAPKVRQLREAVRSVQATPFENPNVKRMTVGQALQGYGTGLESVMAGARRGAVAEYSQEYGKEFTEAQMNFQTEVRGQMAQYGNLWSEYLQQLKAGPTAAGITGGGIRQDPNYTPMRSLAQTPWTVGEYDRRSAGPVQNR